MTSENIAMTLDTTTNTTTDTNDSMDNYEIRIKSCIKHIECPVCYQPADAPIMTCKNGHVLCNQCNRQLINQDPRKRSTGWCPTCKEFGMTRNLPLENIVRDNLEGRPVFECKFRDLGCTARRPFGSLNSHVNFCEFNMDIYSCPFCNIQTPMNRYTLVNHIIDDMLGSEGDSTLRLSLIPVSKDIDLMGTVDSYLASFLDADSWTVKRRKVEITTSKNGIEQYATEYLLHESEWQPDECLTITVYEGLDITDCNFSNLETLREDGDIYTNNITLLFDHRQIYMLHFAANTLPAGIKYTAGYLNQHTMPESQRLHGVRLMLDKQDNTVKIIDSPTQPNPILRKQNVKNTITINHEFKHLQYTREDDIGFYHRFKNQIITDKVCSPTGHHSIGWRLIHS
jgi:hypothetical protein